MTDDLETSGFIITRQFYQISGGRLFQATARGVDLVKGDQTITVDSAQWTGRHKVSEAQRIAISALLLDLRREIESSKLSNTKKANALALVDAAQTLVDAPDPPWPEVMRLLRSPSLGNILAVAGFIFSIVQILVASTGS
ncbi:hypothetical protein [Sphingobium sp. SCG-1]|uniref:hypothetical protein n=1 Tax=Sphingobium sp. SCG-1 TaxID=2072936 RepID=UPI0016705648|nr:hypothetical protein [Sphingobium sp. SCG-1]